MCKSYLGIYFTQSWRKEVLAEWILFSSGHLREKNKWEVAWKLHCQISVNKFGLWKKPETLGPTLFILPTMKSQQRELNCPRPHSQMMAQQRNLGLQMRTDSSLHYWTSEKKHSVEINKQKLKKFKKSLCCCGEIRRGKWIKCQTLAHEITRQ